MTLDSSQTSPVKRCAIYTRKSTDHGLQQDFNSLKAQHSICQAYIQSQEHRSWVEAYRYYEDPAQSGATLDRPAMQDLLADVERGLVDVVVVYKLDRLSRSLLDFVRQLHAAWPPFRTSTCLRISPCHRCEELSPPGR